MNPTVINAPGPHLNGHAAPLVAGSPLAAPRPPAAARSTRRLWFFGEALTLSALACLVVTTFGMAFLEFGWWTLAGTALLLPLFGTGQYLIERAKTIEYWRARETSDDKGDQA